MFCRRHEGNEKHSLNTLRQALFNCCAKIESGKFPCATKGTIEAHILDIQMLDRAKSHAY